MNKYGRLIDRLLPVFYVLFLVFTLTACGGTDNNNSSDADATMPEVTAETPATTKTTTNNPIVKMDTNKGTVIIELFADKAPDTVKNFLHYVNEGVYNNTIFHRVVRDTINQAGEYDFDQKKITTIFPSIKNEADNGLKNIRGTIAMARSADPDSAARQFFINVSDNKEFDHKEKTLSGWGYCVFGKVTKGMETMDRISLVKTKAYGPFSKYTPMSPVNIRSITVIE